MERKVKEEQSQETKTILPDEIKKWIEDEAYNDLRKHKYEDLDGVWIAGATSLYQHLSGRVAELEKEVERLKGLAKEAYEAHYDGYGYALEKALKQMNNL